MFDDSGPIIIKYGTGSSEQNDKIISIPSQYRFVGQFDEFSECVITGKTQVFPP